MGPGDTPLLSVLIATLAEREEFFTDLLSRLLPQCEASGEPVEVVALRNNGEKTLAEYREMLLHAARGEYLCFIDDDDLVSDVYIREIIAALVRDEPDVVAFPQLCTGTAAPITVFGLGFQNAPWEPLLLGGMPAYLRIYSHVLPTRAEIARQGTFILEGALGWTQEDQVFVSSVVPKIMEAGGHETRIEKPLYCYMYGRTGHSTQEGPQTGLLAVPDPPEISSPCFRWYGEGDAPLSPGAAIGGLPPNPSVAPSPPASRPGDTPLFGGEPEETP